MKIVPKVTWGRGEGKTHSAVSRPKPKPKVPNRGKRGATSQPNQRNQAKTPSRLSKTLLFRVLGVFLAVVVAAGIVYLRSPTTFPISVVSVEGHYTKIPQSTLKSAMAPFVNTGFFALDLKGLTRSVKALPWVAQVGVRRVWPDKLIIHITQQRPVVQWQSDGLMNAQGELFIPPRKSLPKNLPILEGPENIRMDMWKAFGTMTSQLKPMGLKLSRLMVNSRLSWELILSNDMHVVLGQSDILQRYQRFVKWYKNIFGNRGKQVKYVDLRYTNGMAVRWKPTQQGVL